MESKIGFKNQLSGEFSCMLGVRQGECLSLFLFSMFLNSLEEEFIINGIDGIDTGMTELILNNWTHVVIDYSLPVISVSFR